MTRVRVIASSPIVRAGLEALLREDARLVVLTNDKASRSASNSLPDVLLIEAASMDGLTSNTAFVRDDAAGTVLLVDRLARAEIRRALHGGVRAILPRDATGPEIVAAIEGVAAGLIVLSSEDMDALLPSAPDLVATESFPGDALSSRELEVLAMLAEGLGNKDIAARLKISEHTVKFHVSSILGKLRATTRGEAVARGVREGLIVI